MDSLIILVVSAFFSWLITTPTILLAKRLNLVTNKKKRQHPAHTHTGIIPRGGGIPIYTSLLITTLLFIPLNKIVIGILLSSFLLIIVGLIDDYSDSSPYLRFIANLLISAVVVSFGLNPLYLQSFWRSNSFRQLAGNF